ncbi:Wadjet anti-phage system protein JetD domain-containing protein [Anaerocolumna sp. MB42-C2]|uniref:Wadjet anti-phage system protein JetD domain-containing protein n=1 Tax=Anaerocolumna sp. MB42-C2 TaxID=3070997 RepID=UPI0027DFED05|nr:Wadjet anti-phage system protein JetD domain-containing protein [Anaerocolumna sp. MB42-C2]WMJ89758.1 DUF2220 family protein [Anaerocolumna sp. MB42-C2]
MPDINKIKSKFFTYLDVMKAFHISDYVELKAIIEEWIAEDKIIPVKKRGMTSFIPRIYSEYKKVTKKEDYKEYEKEIRKLHPDMDITRYLKNPKQFIENKEKIIKLSEYLWNNRETLSYNMSVKERSYDIWRNEKFLESAAGKQICSWNHLNNDYLNCFYAPESFFFLDLHVNSPIVTALVIENKDTWYSLGKSLKQSEKKILFDVQIDIIIYGEGNKATKPEALGKFMDEITDRPYRILYAGDIDIAGIDMLYRCLNNNREGSIKPFVRLYKHMLKKAIYEDLEPTDDNRGIIYDKCFLDYFTENEEMLIKRVLDSNKRIPQEILNYRDYLKLVR